jgi:hypothetical protein
VDGEWPIVDPFITVLYWNDGYNPVLLADGVVVVGIGLRRVEGKFEFVGAEIFIDIAALTL